MNKFFIPRLKPVVEFCWKDNKIYFFNRPGIAIEMEDPLKFISTVCHLMDGKKDVEQIKQSLFPQFSKEICYLESLLTALDNEYLLEDVLCQKNTLSDYEVTRWSRNIEFFGAYCKASENKYSFQEKLKSSKVALFGLGGVGSNVLYNLVAMGVCNIKAIDYDQVELSNLNRQILYDEFDIGHSKSAAAKNHISKFLSNSNIEFINKKISSSDDIEEIIVGNDIIISAIDHPREKIMDWFNLACIKREKPFLCGAIDSRVAICYTIFPGKTGCIECWKSSVKKPSITFQELLQYEGFVSANSPNVAIMPLISIVSGLIANDFLKIVTQIGEPQSLGKLCTFDFITSQITTSESWDKNPDCPICRKG